MGKINNQMVFTDWYKVTICSSRGYVEKEIPVPKFLKELEKNLKSLEYNIVFDEDINKFMITYDGVDYDVILNNTEQKCLETKQYSPLILKLLWLATLDKKYTDEIELQKYREERINSIIKSNYEDMVTLEDHELYLEYLNASLKKTKQEDERNTINTKIAAIIPIIDKLRKEESQKVKNPLNLRLYINRFIYDALKQIDELDDEDRIALAGELKLILIDFKKIVDEYNAKKDKGLVIGDPMLPSSILERIIDLEFKIKNVVKKENISSYVENELGDLEKELRSKVEDKGGRQNGR